MSESATLENKFDLPVMFQKTLLPEDSKDYIFDTSYRCDTKSCGAQAYIKTTFTSGGSLLWCVHHAREAESKILPLLSEWYSEENRLKENRHKGSEN